MFPRSTYLVPDIHTRLHRQRQKDSQTEPVRQPDRHTDRQTNRQTHARTHVPSKANRGSRFKGSYPGTLRPPPPPPPAAEGFPPRAVPLGLASPLTASSIAGGTTDDFFEPLTAVGVFASNKDRLITGGDGGSCHA